MYLCRPGLVNFKKLVNSVEVYMLQTVHCTKAGAHRLNSQRSLMFILVSTDNMKFSTR